MREKIKKLLKEFNERYSYLMVKKKDIEMINRIYDESSFYMNMQ